MLNAVILHCPGDEDRARWIARGWNAGRATLALMGPNRRRIALGARSVLIGLWSERATAHDGGDQFAGVLAHSAPRSALVVWDGRPPLDAVTRANVPVIIAPQEPGELMSRLTAVGRDLFDGETAESDLGGRPRRAVRRIGAAKARSWGILVGALIGALLAIGGLAPIVARMASGGG